MKLWMNYLQKDNWAHLLKCWRVINTSYKTLHMQQWQANTDVYGGVRVRLHTFHWQAWKYTPVFRYFSVTSKNLSLQLIYCSCFAFWCDNWLKKLDWLKKNQFHCISNLDKPIGNFLLWLTYNFWLVWITIYSIWNSPQHSAIAEAFAKGNIYFREILVKIVLTIPT